MSARKIPIGEVVDIYGGGTPSREHPEYYNGRIPWASVKDLGGGFQIYDTEEHISEIGLRRSASRLVPAGSVIVSTRMAVGRAVINQRDIAINQDLKALICREPLFPQYLLFYLTFVAPKLESAASGATVKGITTDDLKEMEIPVPDLVVQKRIAGMLAEADRLRRTRRYALELSNTFLPAAFLKHFGDPIRNDKKWPTTELGEHIDFLTSGSRGWACYYAKEGDLFIRIQNVGWGGLILDDLTRVVPPKNSEAVRTLTKPGDVLLSITADLGRSAWIPDGFPPAYINQHLALIRQRHFNPIFLAFLLSCDAAKIKWGSFDRDAVKSGLNFDDVRRFRVVDPPIDKQNQFAGLLTSHQRLRAKQRESFHQADHLFSSLLSQVFE